ncbi:MAG: tetratricopeptide repeat protein, partial [Candidatus Electrothrix sp. AUS1_2]|nr:tetratricopeptide repeat protein [Candidatus Electrothrix sp. AUS1_2]
TSARLGFWSQVKKEKRTDEYGFIIEQALNFIDDEPELQPQYFSEVAQYYHTRKNMTKAEDALRIGILHLPDHAPFHLLLGEIYLERGEKDAAITEYEQAAALDPENKEIQRRLNIMRKK